jgi:tRNA(Arg) A34 adenosine deaminase TadA
MNDKQYLQLAVEQAKQSVKEGGFPAGSVVVKDDVIISRGISIGFKLNDATSHSEISSIREACHNLQTTNLSGATLYASVQPCLMCFSAAYWAGISRIVFGCKKTNAMVEQGCYEGTTDIEAINQENNHQIELVYIPDFEEEMVDMLTKWSEETNS